MPSTWANVNSIKVLPVLLCRDLDTYLLMGWHLMAWKTGKGSHNEIKVISSCIITRPP